MQMNTPSWRYLELGGTVVGLTLAALLLLALGGCSGMTLQPDYADMSAKQIRALTADKSVGVWCGSVGAYGKAVYVSADMATGKAAQNGRTTKVDGNTCTTEITETPPPK